MEILFVRHGETEANRTNLFYGRLDYGLTQTGREQAKKAGNLVRMMSFAPDRIVVSGLRRTHETLEAMGFPMEDAEIEPRLDERSLGVLEGLTFPEITERYPDLFERWDSDWLDFAPDGGESQREFSGRVRDYLEELRSEDHRPGKVLVATHGGTIKTIISIILGDVSYRFNQIEIYNCSILRVRLTRDGFKVDALYNVVDFEL
ncbi:histidine phosphatase family protein [Youngiibacter fragilis]|uniref:Alpha-ribazole phosphatase n=1 Tax=Youngiibacter fragilis 232.1 TaxID=994573 RepID=V7I7T8_9CLOT|nr:histidine phosphatase family protein [Youngiibacter fragilis]ETA81948.1 alpha-ribazole phosphatase [Youngiibacter fragilis 232.1]